MNSEELVREFMKDYPMVVRKADYTLSSTKGIPITKISSALIPALRENPISSLKPAVAIKYPATAITSSRLVNPFLFFVRLKHSRKEISKNIEELMITNIFSVGVLVRI